MEDAQFKPMIQIFLNEHSVSTNLARFVVDKANEAIRERGIFTVGLSGGSAAKYLSEQLPLLDTDWSKWRVFFCDERHVGYDDPECTYAFYDKHLFKKVGIPADCVFPDNWTVPVEEAATAYTESLKSVFGDVDWPTFDFLLLGMGPDGHTCSLFPGHPLLNETKKWIAAISDSPKPPSERITMTLPVLLHARCAVFVACGPSKAEIVQRAVQGTEQPSLPASRVQPHSGTVCWFLDKTAASLLDLTGY